MLDLLKRGSVAGVSAGIAVAAGVLVYDLFSMTPLATPDALARNLMGGPVVTNVEVGAFAWIGVAAERAYGLAGYSLAHLAIFALVGVLGAWLFRSGRAPANILTGALFGLAVGTGVFYGGVALLAPSFVGVPPWQLVVTMNAIAGIVLVAQLTDDPAEDAGAPAV